ncbi:MAG: family 2A encapsulin nanocompartment shell protein, partial [Terriglobales bacterium]
MAEKAEVRHTLSEQQARQLANVTKTVPMMDQITPRWLVTFLSWVPVEAGTYRVNKVKPTHPGTRTIECSPDEEIDLPEIYVDYEEKPREYTLNAVTTVLDVQTRISDLYRSPHDQIREQLRLMIEKVKERQENELVNNAEYGLVNNVAADFRVKTRKGAPTPDDLDELIARVWKEPGFFLAHPRAIAAFGRECTRRGVPPPTINLYGTQFLTWRGIPLVPSDKLAIKGEKTNILLLRTGEKKQGVIGLFQPGLPGEVTPSLSVRFMGINHKAQSVCWRASMSINTTSTSDPLVTDGPTSSSTPATAQEEGTQKYQGVSALMSAVPDPAVIAKLANEFFAALPGAPVPPNAPSSLSPPQAEAIPAAPGAAVPDYPRGMFSFPAAPNAPQPTSPASALSEADFRAIAASLAGELPLAPQVTTAAPPAAISLSASSTDAGSGGPWAAAPQIPPAAEMYSFPGVPAVPASSTAGPPSGSDAAAVPSSPTGSAAVGRTDPWAEDPHFAGLNDVFSFPRVPGASVPAVPAAQASQPSIPASQPDPNTIAPAGSA